VPRAVTILAAVGVADDDRLAVLAVEDFAQPRDVVGECRHRKLRCGDDETVCLQALDDSAPPGAVRPGAQPTSAAALKSAEISVPVAVAFFPDDVYRAPESWARRAYSNLVYFNEVGRGGHFAAWEQPQLFTEELRAAFRAVR
jgi:pimeloyl-ACP methyl ester carboxylesterase